MSSRRFPLLLVGAFAALYLIWGSTYFVIRIGVQSWPPMLLAGLRFVVAGSLMFAWLRWRGVPLPTAKEWRSCAIVGFLLLSCGNGGVTIAEHLGVASAVAALAIATVPLFALLFGLIWGQRTTGLEWGGILLGLIGIGLLNLGHNLQASPLGAVIVLLAAASWAFGSMWSRHLSLPNGAMASAAQMLVGGAVLLFGSLVSGERLQQMPDMGGWLALIYLTILGSIVAFSAYLYLLKHVRPAAATSYAYVNPVVAVLLGITFAGERIGPEEWLAMTVIVSAVILIGLPQWRRPKVAAVASET
ncbi:drug/metabolite exporter YedA [Stutzerimonas zhaodongensis]|jgi:drug/metabolite transporter (DMT)-like permease|uniref:drug/metabolite exporter YedA n=1 Tax=Stutzerimonas zhaodongensis TaxID=1176257 RepID=UPI001F4EB381|nr:drug/metabolite exporter YedA [Stutzerimonas zhaodongensis]UNG16938.1 drug/metabolite exporter YedA [Stutzerimonas zhaodongensis]